MTQTTEPPQLLRADFFQDLEKARNEFLQKNALTMARQREVAEQIAKLRIEECNIKNDLNQASDDCFSPFLKELDTLPKCVLQHSRSNWGDEVVIVEAFSGPTPSLRVMNVGSLCLGVGFGPILDFGPIPSGDVLGDVYEWDGSRFFKPDSIDHLKSGGTLILVPDRYIPIPQPQQPYVSPYVVDAQRPRTRRP